MALKIEQAEKEINEKILSALQKAGLKIEYDAKKNCPVVTGTLQSSIHTELAEDEKAVYVGTAIEYAPYVEYRKPYLLPALDKNREDIIKMFEGLI